MSDLVSIGNLSLSAIAILVSIYSLYLSKKANKLQAKVNELDLIIKEQQVKEINDRTVPKLKFEIVNNFGKQYNLMVKNIGNVIVYNVKIEEKHSGKYLSWIDPSLSINLESEEDFSPRLIITKDTPRILEFKFTWQDETKNIYSETKSFDWLSSMPVSRIA